MILNKENKSAEEDKYMILLVSEPKKKQKQKK